MKSNSSAGAPGAGNSDSSVVPSFPNVDGPSAASEGLYSAAPEGLASVGVECPASTTACAMPASTDFFILSPSALGASEEEGVNAFVDSITTSSTLAILLLFGVVAGILVNFALHPWHGL